MTAIPKEESEPALIGFRCVCGLQFAVDLRQGPACFSAECPDERCRRIYVVEYVGQKMMPPQPPAVRLATLLQ